MLGYVHIFPTCSCFFLSTSSWTTNNLCLPWFSSFPINQTSYMIIQSSCSMLEFTHPYDFVGNSWKLIFSWKIPKVFVVTYCKNSCFLPKTTPSCWDFSDSPVRCGTLDLPLVLHEKMDLYMKHVVLPPSIALTRALKENVFSVIVGIDTWTTCWLCCFRMTRFR